MIKEYGGYMPLELNKGLEHFDKYKDANVARFNCGRNAIAAAFMAVKPQKVYLPYYICAVVRETLEKYNLPYELYLLDDMLEPMLDYLEDDEWLLYVNYFGTMPDVKMERIVKKYKRVLIDHTQAFYATPILDDTCFNVFLPRKFFGLIDGAYLIWGGSRQFSFDYPKDTSWDRGAFLLKSAELGTNAAYQDNLDSMDCYADGVRMMSTLTEKMLKSIDYEKLGQIRQRNYRVLVDEFRDINEHNLPMEGYAPYVYPLLVKKDTLRKKVVDRKIYAPQWWKYLIQEVPEKSIERTMSEWLLPLPVDHRYTEDDMKEMAGIVKEIL